MRMLYLYLLVTTILLHLARGDIDRSDENFHAEFSVINHGRLHHYTVLMFLDNIDVKACMEFCIKHLRCKTLSYHFALRMCEINDQEFNEMDAYTEAEGWYNYGTPDKVDGKFGNWITSFPPCICGKPKKMVRFCDSPPPRHGGKMCVGEREKTELCDDPSCDILANEKRAKEAKSTDWATKVSFVFTNKHSNPVRLIWKDYQGNPDPRGEIKPSQRFWLSTYASHPFIARDVKTNQLVHFTNGRRTDIIAEGSAFGAPATSSIQLDIVP